MSNEDLNALSDEEFEASPEAFRRISDQPTAPPNPTSNGFATEPVTITVPPWERRTYYYSPDSTGHLFYEQEGQWYRISAYDLTGTHPGIPCDIEKEGWSMEAFDDKREPNQYRPELMMPSDADRIAAAYAPRRDELIDSIAETLTETLTIQEREQLLYRLLLKRNLDTTFRMIAAGNIPTINRKRIAREFSENWLFNIPHGAPIDDELRAAEQAEEDRIKANPEEGRELHRMEPDAANEYVIPIQEGYMTAVPLWERATGKNWAALLSVRSGALDRAFINGPRGKRPEGDTRRYWTGAIQVGSVIEFAADYHHPRAGQTRTRGFFACARKSDTEIVFVQVEAATPEEAIKKVGE